MSEVRVHAAGSREPRTVREGRTPKPVRKVDVSLPGKGNSNSNGARPVHLIITMIKWIRTNHARDRASPELYENVQP